MMETKLTEHFPSNKSETESILSTSSLGSKEHFPSVILFEGGYNILLKGQTCTLDGSLDESFTLEPYENLIKVAYAKRKSFIIARVTTADTVDPMKLYCSYYAAHHINKVLFRTQPELGLLHRMKSKNPLNNMAIVGDVDYFVITPESVEKSLKELHMQIKKKEFKENKRKSSTRHKRTMSDPSWQCLQKTNSKTSLIQSCQDSLLGNSERTEENVRIVYRAQFIASDDDYLMRTEVREFFKINSVNPDDYLLFTLYAPDEYQAGAGMNGDHLADPIDQAGRRRPRPKCSNLFGCINTRPTPSLTNRFTGLLTSRGLAAFFLLYIIIAVATLKFLVPLSYVYLAGFLFAFSFVLVLVLFAEAGPSR